MKFARRLRQEVDLWGVAWQQVETFVDRISGAADSDASARRTVEALLSVASVVERARRPLETKPLGAPVLRTLPTAKADSTGKQEPISDAWEPDERITRLPGLDELELAAGPVSAVDEDDEPIDDDLTLVRLVGARTVPVRVAQRSGVVTQGVMPSYDPGVSDPGSSIVGGAAPANGVGGRFVDIAGSDADLASLFSVPRRVIATMGTAPDTEQVRTWGELAADRRKEVGATTLIPVDPPSVAGRAAALAAEATQLVGDIRAGRIQGAAAGAALSALAATAQVSGGTDAQDAAALEAAAEILEDEGTKDPGLPDAVRGLAAALRSTPGAQQAVASAISQLAGSPMSNSLQDNLLDRAAVLGVTASSAELLGNRVEDGPLGAELDQAVAARLHYPDGSLRMLRTMESAFVWTWPARVRWFTTRRDLVLSPLVARFRAPFHTSLRALVSGGDTGLLALGLTVGPDLAVGSTQVVTGEPASLLPSVDDIEPGQVGVVGGPRPAVLTVLGLDVANGRLALQVAPVRVATAAGEPGVAGLVSGGAAIGASSAGLSADELRTGESAQGFSADGVVAEMLALWSQSCAVFGRASVEGASVAIPDPPGGPLEQLQLHGAVPARATTIVLTDLPAAMWDRSDPADPVPRVARSGEVLLLRGTAQPQDGGPATVVQGVVEVDSVIRTTGSMLAAMDLSAAGRLSTSALDVQGDGPPLFRCGPEDDVVVMTLRRSTVDVPLAEPVTLRRDFAGFDVMSLAARRLLPPELFGESPAATSVDRSREFAFASDTLAGWLRYAHHG